MSEAGASFDKDGIKNILIVAFSVCLVCSVLVSVSAVALKPLQSANKELDRRTNILLAAALIEQPGAPAEEVNSLFDQFEGKVVDLRTGEYASGIDAATFDQLRSTKDSDVSRELTSEEDIATLGRLEQYALVYVQTDGQGDISKLVLPIRGYGLWGTLYGYVALEGDLNTIAGLGFYEHSETPGLGGEVENPKWKGLWPGVKAYDGAGEPAVRVVKARSPTGSAAAAHEVDALSGATLTSVGVENLMKFWLGDMGFGPYLKQLKATGAR